MLPQAFGAMKMRPLRSPNVPTLWAPASNSARQTSKWPWKTAQCNAVRFQRSSQSLRAEPQRNTTIFPRAPYISYIYHICSIKLNKEIHLKTTSKGFKRDLKP